MLPAAMIDVMMADLPHVLYGKDAEEHFTEDEAKKAYEKSKALQAKVKSGGLGLKLNLNKAKEANALISK